MNISLEQAHLIIEGALNHAADMAYKPLAVAVLDSGAHLVAYARQDGASAGRFQIASGKANGAIMLGMGSRAIMNRAEQQAYFINAAAGAFDGKLIPVPGGVLIKDAEGRLLGAVGISGETSDNDEAACLAGINAADLVGETG